MLGLALGLAVAAADPSVAVLVVRRTSVSVEEGRAFADAAAVALRAAAVEVEEPAESLRRLSSLGVSDPTACSGRKACVLELARQLEVGAVVAISAAQLQGERSVVLEAWSAKDGAQLAKDAVVLPVGATLVPEHLKAVSRALAGLFPARKKAEAPVVVVAEPPVAKPPPEVVSVPPPAPEPAPKSHVPTWVMTALAVAAAAGSAGVGASALTARGHFFETMSVNGQMTWAHPASEAQAYAGAANLQGGIAGGLAVLAVALAVIAVVLW